jgi:hypothetical protein
VSNIFKMARLHLVDRFGYTWLVWGVLAFRFLVNLLLFAVIGPTESDGSYTGALASIYIFMIIIGVQAAVRFLPFALTLGVSRRTYYLGTIALIVGLNAVNAVLLTLLWWLELGTDCWASSCTCSRCRGSSGVRGTNPRTAEPANTAEPPNTARERRWPRTPVSGDRGHREFDGAVGIRPVRAPSPAALPRRPAPPAR